MSNIDNNRCCLTVNGGIGKLHRYEHHSAQDAQRSTLNAQRRLAPRSFSAMGKCGKQHKAAGAIFHVEVMVPAWHDELIL